MNQTSKQYRVLAISLSTRGFGYAIMERENGLVECGKKRVDADKNAGSLKNIETMIARIEPDCLVLHDVNAKGTYRRDRIKQLHRKVIALAKKRTLKVVKISKTELRELLLNDKNGTKQEMAALMAKRFPEQLALRLPAERKAWDSEDARMDIFDAVGLMVAYWLKQEKSLGKLSQLKVAS